MDNFTTIYTILRILEGCMDSGFNKDLIAPDKLGITPKRLGALLLAMQDDDLVSGVTVANAVGQTAVRYDGLRITVTGLEYLEENEMMKRVKDNL